MKRKIMYALLLPLLVLSCRKEQQKATTTTAPGTTLSLEQVKAFYKSDTTSNLSWDKATNNTGTKIPYWLVPLNGRPRFQNLGLGYRQMAFYIDSSKNINARIIETIPDATYLQRKQQVSGTDFTGRIFVYDTNYRLLYGKVYLNGKQIGRIRPTVADDKPVKVEMTAPVTECFWAADNYVDGNGNAVIYSEQICSTSYIDLGGGGGGDGSSGGPDPVNSQADLPPKGNGSGAATPPPVSNLPGENKSGINPKDYMKCFQTIPDNGATMKITVYVQEPGAAVFGIYVGDFITFLMGFWSEIELIMFDVISI